MGKVEMSSMAGATMMESQYGMTGNKGSRSGAARAFELLTLGAIMLMAFSIRLFSVLKYESVIHEFDPYFNYRVTALLTEWMESDGPVRGLVRFWNFFDSNTWYPLGRIVGGTLYPGLMLTAGLMWWILHALNIPIHVAEVCVFTAPIFSANTAWATYLLGREIRGPGAGLAAAALVAIVPSYISRSVAGSYDNEGIAIFALVLTFYLYVKTLNTGSLAWGTLNALAYLYMVSSWGGYTFIINLLPIHVLASMIMGRMTKKLYIAYAPLVVLGTLLAMLIQAVGFNAVRTSEHYASFMVLILLQVAMTFKFLHKIFESQPAAYRAAIALLSAAGIILFVGAAFLMVFTVIASPTLGWSGRSLTLLDPTYAKRFIPIIASVSEHQPTAWTSYFMDIHITALLLPAGLVSTLRPLSDGSLFALLYAITSLYFSGVMVRLMLVVAPAACLLSGMAISDAFSVLTKSLKMNLANTTLSPLGRRINKFSESPATKDSAAKKKVGRDSKSNLSDGNLTFHALPRDSSIISGFVVLIICLFYSAHCVWVSSEAYSAPSIVLSTRSPSGTHIFDDFREAYSWLRHCTEPDDIVASWWDYGYQTTAIANRTVLVDNNTWNNTHIATVGRAMASPEGKAWKIYRSLDVKYVFVVFGGLVGYPSDDINKFLWMVRIGGGVFPEIKEPDYMGEQGFYRIDNKASKVMLNTLMYRLSYYRFAEMSAGHRGMEGYDRVRNAVIGVPNFKLTHFEEVFTSEHWMVRIYKLKEPSNRTRHKSSAKSSDKKSLGRSGKGRVLVSKESGSRSRLLNKYHWEI